MTVHYCEVRYPQQRPQILSAPRMIPVIIITNKIKDGIGNAFVFSSKDTKYFHITLKIQNTASVFEIRISSSCNKYFIYVEKVDYLLIRIW